MKRKNIVSGLFILFVVVVMFKVGRIGVTTDSSKIPTATRELTDMEIIEPYILGWKGGCIQVVIKSKNYYTGNKGDCPGFSYIFMSLEDIANKIRKPDDH